MPKQNLKKNEDDEHAELAAMDKRQATENLKWAMHHQDAKGLTDAIFSAQFRKVDESVIEEARERTRELQMEEAAQVNRTVFGWVGLQDSKDKGRTALKHETISFLEVARSYGVLEERLMRHVKEEITEADACASLPFTLLMVIAYTLMVSFHDPNVTVYAVEESLVYDIEDNSNHAATSPDAAMAHKGIEDVNSAGDFWSWMIQGFVPLFWGQEVGFSEGVDPEDNETWLVYSPPTQPDDPNATGTTTTSQMPAREFPGDLTPDPRVDRGVIVNYNRVIGGVRLRQDRFVPRACTIVPGNAMFFNASCTDGGGYQAFPELWDAFKPTEPQSEVWLWIHDDIDRVLDTCIQMESEASWFDETTKKIEFAMAIYNAERGVYSYVTVNFYFSRGGHIWKRIIPMSTHTNWFPGVHSIVTDSIWLFCLMWIVRTEAKKIRQKYVAAKWHGLIEYAEVYVIIDWVSAALGLSVVYGFLGRVRETARLNEAMATLVGIPEDDQQEAYRNRAMHFMDMLQVEVHGVYWFRLNVGAYPIVVVFRLFKAFSAQPRLSIVTKTLSSSFVDVLHFLLVFASIFFSSAMGGVLIFGRDVPEFNSFYKATCMCFRVMMGDFDWDELQEIGRIRAGTWFIMFNLVVVILLLNMLLAVIMDAYNVEKTKLGDAETLWAEFLQTVQRTWGRHKGTVVRLHDVLACLLRTQEQGFRSSTSFGFGKSEGSRASHGGSQNFGSEAGPKSEGRGSALKRKSMKRASSMMDVDQFEHKAVVKLKEFMERVPKLQREQAEELFLGAIGDFYQENKEDANIEEMQMTMRKMNLMTKQMKHKIKESIAKSAYDDSKSKTVVVEHMEEDEDEQGETNTADGGEPNTEDGGERKDSVTPGQTEGQNRAQQFLGCLHKCYIDLHKAKRRVGSAPRVDEIEAILKPAASTIHGLMPKMGVRLTQPLTGLNQITELSLVQVLEDPRAVLAACHSCGLTQDNDMQRHKAAGSVGRVLARDWTDGTVKVQILEIGTLWFGLQALELLESHALRSRIAEPSLNDIPPVPRLAPTSGDMEQAQHTHRTEEERRAKEMQQRARDLENELRVGRQTIAESEVTVAELEVKVRMEQEMKEKVAVAFKELKTRVQTLSIENHNFREEARTAQSARDDKVKRMANTSRSDYYALVMSMLDENRYLRDLLQEPNRSEVEAEAEEVLSSAGFSDHVDHLRTRSRGGGSSRVSSLPPPVSRRAYATPASPAGAPPDFFGAARQRSQSSRQPRRPGSDATYSDTSNPTLGRYQPLQLEPPPIHEVLPNRHVTTGTDGSRLHHGSPK